MDHSRTFRDMIVVFLISLLTTLFYYLLRIYLARRYTISEYGLVYSLITFFSLFLVFVDLGLFQSQIKKVSEFRAKNNELEVKRLLFTSLLFQSVIAIVISMVLFFTSKYITLIFFHSSEVILFKVMLIWFLTYPLYYLIGIYTLSYEKTTLWAFFELIKVVVLIIMALILFKVGILSIIIGYACVNLILFIILILIGKDFFNRDFLKAQWSLLYPETLKYGFFICFTGIAGVALTQIDTLMVTSFLGLDKVAMYQIAVPISNITIVLVNTITVVLFSKASNLWAKEKREEVAVMFKLLQKYLLLFLLPAVFVLILFSGQIIYLLFGDKYLAAQPILMVLSVGYLFAAFSILINYLMVAIGFAKTITKIFFFGLIFNIIAIYLLMIYFNVLGVALAVLITHLLIFSILIFKVNKILNLKFPLIIWLKTLLASIMFGGIIYSLGQILPLNSFLKIIVCILVSGFAYVLACYLLKIITIKELQSLKNIIPLSFFKS